VHCTRRREPSEPPIFRSSDLPIFRSIVIGSMASAEERQLGVSEWQLLLPMPARLQWIVKAAVTLGLTGVLVLAVFVAASRA
jgi:hypothetical protein